MWRFRLRWQKRTISPSGSLKQFPGTGEATIVQICKDVWEHHESELRASGDLFYTWGYDIRWAGQWLRNNDYRMPIKACKRGVSAPTTRGKTTAATRSPCLARPSLPAAPP